MSNLPRSVACEVYPIKNGWKILRGSVRIGLASSLEIALSKISRISADSGILYRIRIFKEDGSIDAGADDFSPESAPTPDAAHSANQAENVNPAVSVRERISLLAYSYWEERGCQGGSPEEDWYRAEQATLKQSLMRIRGAPDDT
jgi:hypothetical protein